MFSTKRSTAAPSTPEEESTNARKASERATVWRVFAFFSAVVLITGTGGFLMADYLWSLGWSAGATAIWLLFVVLFSYLSFGFCHALFGFLVRRCHLSGATMPIADEAPGARFEDGDLAPRVAVVIPVYNEPVDRVFSGIRAIFDSIKRKRQGHAFDFFILSDSTKPEQWLAEEAAWMQLCRKRNAQDRIFYRRRPENVGKKSGNISDFCRTWGEHYRYMVVLDADSIMTGDTLVELFLRMEANPRVGLIQTAPALVGGESLYGRMQQFANRLYGPLFAEGLAFWQECGGNCWGHNAIIRLRPFREHCDLPELPGRKPFGGHILSHDFVEAGLLRRAGYEVWLAHDLDGSYEEGPQGIIESAQRDQRWCQGNLQHGLLLFARGLRGKTRIHLANGILGYAASPLWLLFMLVSAFKVARTDAAVLFDASNLARGLLVLALTMTLLFGPKILSLLDLALDTRRASEFGGRLNAFTSAIVETIFSALLAPINMLFHTRFVVTNLLGHTVGWSAQTRGAAGTSWDAAIAVHGPHTLTGIVAGILAAAIDPVLFWWLSPVLAGLWLSIPLSVWTSQSGIGAIARKEGLFLSPDENDATPEVAEALSGRRMLPATFDSMTDAVLDPFLNAVHISLLRRNRRRLLHGRKVYGKGAAEHAPSLGVTHHRRFLAERLLREGPRSLSSDDLVELLSDIDNMLWIHRQAWLRPFRELAPAWQSAIQNRF